MRHRDVMNKYGQWLGHQIWEAKTPRDSYLVETVKRCDSVFNDQTNVTAK